MVPVNTTLTFLVEENVCSKSTVFYIRYIIIPLDKKVIPKKKKIKNKHFNVQPFDKRVYDFLLNTSVHIIINNVVLYSI